MDCREVPRWTTDSRSQIEQSHAAAQLHLRSDGFSCFPSPNVEFVHCHQVVGSDARARFPGHFERSQNPLFQIFRCVMQRNPVFRSHGIVSAAVHGLSHLPLLADRNIASITLILPNASSRGTGTCVSSRMVRENASPCTVYWSQAGISSISTLPP